MSTILEQSPESGNDTKPQDEPNTAKPQEESNTKGKFLTFFNSHSNKKIRVIFIASLWCLLTNIERAIIFPTLYLNMLQSYNVTTADQFYAITLGSFNVMVLIFTPIYGLISAKNIMTVKNLLLVSEFLGIVGCMIFFIYPAYHPWVMVLGRAIAGIGASCEVPIFSDIVRVTKVTERTSVLLFVILMRQIGTLLGPGLILFFKPFNTTILSVNLNVLNSPGWLMATFWIFTLLITLIIYPNISHFTRCGSIAENNARYTLLEDQKNVKIWSYLKRFRLLILLSINFASLFTLTAMEAMFGPFAKKTFGWDESQVALVYIISGALVFIVFGMLVVVSKFVVDRTLIIFGLIVLIINFSVQSIFIWLSNFSYFQILTFSKTDLIILMTIGIVLSIIGLPFTTGPVESLFTKFVPCWDIDRAQTILRTVHNIAYCLGAVIGGVLKDFPAILLSIISIVFLCPGMLFVGRFKFFVSNEAVNEIDEKPPLITQPKRTTESTQESAPSETKND